MAIVIPVEGTPYEMTATTHPEAFGGLGMNLETMQALVGGYIEHLCLLTKPGGALVEVDPGEFQLVLTNAPGRGRRFAHLVINEVGKLEGLPVNVQATFNCLAIEAISPDDWIAGPAIFLTDDEMQ